MKSNQVRVRVSSRRGVMPFGSVDTKIDSKHLSKLLVFVLELMAADERNASQKASRK